MRAREMGIVLLCGREILWDVGGFGNLFPILSHPKCSSHVSHLKQIQTRINKLQKWRGLGCGLILLGGSYPNKQTNSTQTRSFAFCVAIRSSISEDPAFLISILRTHHVDFSTPCIACPPIQYIIFIIDRISCLLC